MRGVSVNENASSAKVWKLVVETVSACMNEAASEPDDAADQAQQQRLAAGTPRGSAPREKPSARSVPISPTRDATLAYIVIIAPMIAPIEKMTEIDVPRYVMNFDSASRLVGVEAPLALGFDGEPRIALELALHVVEAVGIGEPEQQRREAGAAERLQHLLGVAPDLGVEAGAAAVEHADDRPVARREAHGLAEAGALEAAGDRAAGDDFRGARAGTSGPRRSCTCGRNARPAAVTPRITTFDGLAGVALRQVDQHDRLLRHQPRAVGADRDVGQALDDRRLPRGRCRSAPRSARRGG